MQRQRYLSTIESPDGRLERLQRRRQREGQTEICKRTLSPCFQLCERKICSFTVEVGRRSLGSSCGNSL